jgi:hypothetical protein
MNEHKPGCICVFCEATRLKLTPTVGELKEAASKKCNEICNREYAKYLEATQAARDEYFDLLKQFDSIPAETKNPLPVSTPKGA